VKSGTHVVERREVGRSDLPFEFMLNALRLAAGFPVSMFAERTDWPSSRASARSRRPRRADSSIAITKRIRPTALGRRYLTI